MRQIQHKYSANYKLQMYANMSAANMENSCVCQSRFGRVVQTSVLAYIALVKPERYVTAAVNVGMPYNSQRNEHDSLLQRILLLKYWNRKMIFIFIGNKISVTILGVVK